jgi:hypothetical protein
LALIALFWTKPIGLFLRNGQGCVAADTKRPPAADAKMVAKTLNNAITKIFKRYPKA